MVTIEFEVVEVKGISRCMLMHSGLDVRFSRPHDIISVGFSMPAKANESKELLTEIQLQCMFINLSHFLVWA